MVRRGEAINRIDAQFLGLEGAKRIHYAAPQYPLRALRELVELVQYGISERANSEGLGTPILRMNNLQANGWDFTEVKHIELDEKLLEKYRLEPGDLLFNRTNSKELVGKCEMFDQSDDWVFASYLIRVRLNQKVALPRFISDFLNSPAGRIQIDQVSRQIAGMSNVNAEELQDLEIPLPPLDIQRRLVAELDAARAERDKALAEADDLLSSTDELVIKLLGIRPHPVPARPGYAMRLGSIRNSGTLSADYFHPERMLALRQIESVPNAPLGEIVEFKRNIVPTPGTSRYIGLASISSHTGQLTDAVETAEGNCFQFNTSDVLYGRLRPYLNKVWHAEFDGVCSTEFHVMTPTESNLQSEYLALVLRTRLIVAQTKHMMTGNTHPRIGNADVTQLRIPLADKKTQLKIVEATKHSHQQSLKLRTHAETIWREAREKFERQLLKGTKP